MLGQKRMMPTEGKSRLFMKHPGLHGPNRSDNQVNVQHVVLCQGQDLYSITFGRYGDARGSVVRPIGAGRHRGAENVDQAGGVGEVGRRQRQLTARGQVAEGGGSA